MAKTYLINFYKKYSIYSFGGLLELVYFFFKTKIFFKNIKLIRFPIFIRGKRFIKFGRSMSTGRYCRLDAMPKTPNHHNKFFIRFGIDVEIGDRVHIASVKGIEIGDRCLIASNVYISDHDHGKTDIKDLGNHPKKRKLNSKEIVIGSDCWIGQNVCILKGCNIGSNSIVGAGSVVTHSFPSYSVIAGNPAKLINKSRNLENELK